VSTPAVLSSTTISTISDNITNVVGARLEDQVQETVMKAMAEMAHTYFPKIVANHSNDMVDFSEIVIPPCRLQQLRDFLRNPAAQFSCYEQAVLLELMLRRTQNVLGVLGTGLGKTLVILMQATLQNNVVTIVVLPMSSLHDDFKRRALELGVSYSRWNSNGKFNPDVNVISVSIEHLGFPGFVKYVYFIFTLE
jgi:superfamily II DNA helicase RecQ